jgi:uncharacterized membrane protein HdeD (DUF308 family)
VYEYCDLAWGTVVMTGLLAVVAGTVLLLFPGALMSIFVMVAGIIVLLLAGTLIAEGLFSTEKRVPAGVIAAIGFIGIALGILAIVVPAIVALTAGALIGAALVVFGALMAFMAASILFSFTVRALVVVSSLAAIVIGVWFLFLPVTGLAFLLAVTGAFLVLYGVVRVSYGLRLRHWQKSCPAVLQGEPSAILVKPGR